MTDVENVKPAEQKKSESRYFFDGITWTPEIELGTQLVAQWVTGDMCGASFWGLPRVGKSEFARYLEKIAIDLFGGEVLVVRVTFEGEKVDHRLPLLKTMAASLDIRAISTRDPQDLRTKINDEIMFRCTSMTHWIVVIVDEVQNIKQDLYGEFSKLDAFIANKGYRPCFISIGQPELQSTVQNLENNLAITGRQYQNVQEFRGLTFDQIAELLADLEGPDLSFTRKHFPWRAERGWSITSLLEPIKEAVMATCDLDGLNRDLYFPMSYLRQTLTSLFYFLQAPESRDSEVKAKDVLDAFEMNGFKKVMHAYTKPRTAP